MKKKILSALLILTMVLSVFLTTAFAAKTETPEPTPTPSSTAPVEPTLPLQLGVKGEIVKTLQTYLIANGYTLTVSGEYDTATEAAVKLYQAAVGYEVTGITDTKTFERLANVENFLAIAQSKLGIRYVRGGKGPIKFDCSGFVYWTMNQAGIKQGYMNSRAWQKCKTYTRVKKITELLRGDVISFKGHVAIYLGNGQMIDASSSNRKVVIRTNSILKSSYWKRNFVRGFRLY